MSAEAAALAVLGELVKAWVASGKDPLVEAKRVADAESVTAPIDAKLQAIVDSKPEG